MEGTSKPRRRDKIKAIPSEMKKFTQKAWGKMGGSIKETFSRPGTPASADNLQATGSVPSLQPDASATAEPQTLCPAPLGERINASCTAVMESPPQAGTQTITEPDRNVTNPLSSNPTSVKPATQRSESAASKPPTTTALATACNIIKTSLTFIGPFLEGLPIPAKGIVDVTLKIIELTEKIQGNNEAFTQFATRCTLLQDTLRASVSGKDVKNLPKDLLDSIGRLAKQLNETLQTVTNSKPSMLGATIQVDDYANALKEANKSIDQMLQLFSVENFIAGRIALQSIIDGLYKLESYAVNENVKRLDVARSAAYNAYMSGDQQRITCFEGTRASLLSEISSWYTSHGPAPPIYILDGIAGIGKTTVAKTIAERADKMHLLGGSFFFSRNEEELQTARLFCCTIASQLAHYNKDLGTLIGQAIDQHPDDFLKVLKTQFNTYICDPIKNLQATNGSLPILIVIDALDECKPNDAQELLSLLANYIHELPQLRIFITCRPEEHLQELITNNPNQHCFHLHDIEQSVVQNDIHQYLQYHLSEEQVSKALPKLKPVWAPTSSQLQHLLELCGKLFIIASTAIKFILDRRRQNPALQLHQLLESISNANASLEPTIVMDKFYAAILCAAVPCDVDSVSDKDWVNQYQIILGAIVVLQTPLPCSSLSNLLGLESNMIEVTLINLHSLIAPTFTCSTVGNPTFQVHHKSFPDFVTSAIRMTRALQTSSSQTQAIGKELCINSEMQHLALAKHCFQIMSSKLLQWNLRGLDTADWYKDQGLTKNLLPQIIDYACSHWVSHLVEASLDDEVMENIQSWATNYFVAWLEAVCWVRGPSIACTDLLRVQRIIPTSNQQTMAIIQDGQRLLQKNMATLVASSPMHIYWSGFPLLPQGTMLYQNYFHQTKHKPTIILGSKTMWDQTIATLSGHGGSINSVAFSPNGSKIASGSGDCTICLWNAYSGDRIAILEGHTGTVCSIAFAPNDHLIASGSADQCIRIWDGTSGRCTGSCEGHTDEVNSVTFSPSGLILASSSDDNTVRVWDSKSFAQIFVLEGHTGSVLDVAFSPDGSRLVSGSGDRTIKLWNAQSPWDCITTLGSHSRSVSSVAFSPDSCTLASGSYESIKLWNIDSGDTVAALEGHSGWIKSVAFSKDSAILASASSDRTVKLWDAKKGICIATLEGHHNWVNSVSFSPVQNILASGSSDNTARLWDITASKYLSDLESQSTPEVPYPDNSEVAFESDSKDTVCTDPNLSSQPASQTSHSGTVYSVAFSPDGCTLASGSADNTIILWNTQTSSHIATLKGHSGEVNSVIFSPDGSSLASGSDDKTIRLWNAKLGSHLITMKSHTEWVWSVAFSPDGSKLASGSKDKTIRLWDVQSHSCVATLEGHTDSVKSVTFLQHGLKMVSCSDDEAVRVWDIQTESCIATLGSQLDTVYSVALSPDRSMLAGECETSNITAWNTMSNKEVWTFNGSEHSISRVRGVQMSSSHIFAVVKREKPDLWGLVAFKAENDTYSDPVPFMWFPPDMPYIQSFTLHTTDGVASKVAVGCEDGQVLAIDISQVLLP